MTTTSSDYEVCVSIQISGIATFSVTFGSKTMTIQKPALTIARNLLPDVYIGTFGVVPMPPAFFLLPTEIHDRKGENSCEENPAVQQVIPYMVLKSKDGRIFCYSRGAGGAEEKLHAKLSIGIGGHIDAQAPAGSSNHAWFVQEAYRELYEEVGVAHNPLMVFDGLVLDRRKSHEDNGKTYVGQVHVGLLTVIDCEPEQLGQTEANVILAGEWLTIDELEEIIETTVDEGIKFGLLTEDKEPILEQIWEPWRSKECLAFLDKKYPILGVSLIKEIQDVVA